MRMKSMWLTLGLGAAAGTAVGMMLPRNRTMRNLGREVTSAAADTVTRAVDAVEQKMQ